MRWLVLAALNEAVYLGLHIFGDLRPRVVEAIVLIVISGLFYIVSCYFAGKSPVPPAVLAGAALAFRLTVWPLHPALSDDVFRYRWEGKLQSAGGNPYLTRPNDPAWAHLRDPQFDRIPGRDFTAVYGPLIQLIQRATWQLPPKLPAALFDLATLAALAWLLRLRGLPPERLIYYAWCPLPVIEFWATGHNDSLVVFLVVLALALAASSRWTGAFAVLAAAASAKLWPALLLPVFLRRWDRRRPLQPFIILPVAAALALPFWTTDLARIVDNVRFTTGFLSGWRNNDSLFAATLWLSNGDPFLAKRVTLALLAAVSLLAIRWPLEKATFAVILALLLFPANSHPWYLTWLVPLVCFYPATEVLLWIALVPLAHQTVVEWISIGQWNGSTPLRWYIYAPVALVYSRRVVVNTVPAWLARFSTRRPPAADPATDIEKSISRSP